MPIVRLFLTAAPRTADIGTDSSIPDVFAGRVVNSAYGLRSTGRRARARMEMAASPGSDGAGDDEQADIASPLPCSSDEESNDASGRAIDDDLAGGRYPAVGRRGC